MDFWGFFLTDHYCLEKKGKDRLSSTGRMHKLRMSESTCHKRVADS